MDLTTLPLGHAVVIFLAATVTIVVAGSRMARRADRLADVTGWGEALFGAVFLGLSTSLPGVVTSVTAAAAGHAELAISNAIGGIAAQTAFLAVADVFHRRANLEHAAASVPNMMQGALLIFLLAGVVACISAPPVSVLSVHPGSIILIVAYVLGVRMIGRARGELTWAAQRTPETVPDVPHMSGPVSSKTRNRLWMEFAVLAAILGVAGYFVARSGVAISQQTGLSETLVGGLFTGVATSLPELVTSVAAVRAGALTLAVGNIVGGNTFDVLFVALADVAYRHGSIYAAVGERQVFAIVISAALTGVLLLGLLRREKRGIANIGFESMLILGLYVMMIGVLAVW